MIGKSRAVFWLYHLALGNVEFEAVGAGKFQVGLVTEYAIPDRFPRHHGSPLIFSKSVDPMVLNVY